MNNIRRVVAILMIITMLAMGSISSFAVSAFSDANEIPSWAEKFVDKVSSKGIINGYPDESNSLKFYFKPNGVVSKVQAIKMIFETLKASEKLQSTVGLVTKYQTTLTTNKIPSWAHEAVAYALEYNIVVSSELTDFMTTTGEKAARRVDVAVFLGKALKMPLAAWPVLSFIDAEQIVSGAERYVDLLVNKGIVGGDEFNKFNPNNTLKRVEMAKMMALSFDLLNDGTSATPINSNVTVREYTIDSVVSSTRTIFVKDSDNNTDFFRIPTEVQIKLNGTAKSFSVLTKGMKVKLSLDSDENVKDVVIDETVAEFEGTITSIIEYNGSYLVTVAEKDNSSNKKTFTINNDTDIELNGKDDVASSLKSGDSVEMEIENNIVTVMTAETKTQVYYGYLESGVIFRTTTPILKMKTSNTKIVELEIDDDADVEKNNKKSTLAALVKGDSVKVTTEYGKVVDVEATSTKEKDEGTLIEMTMGSTYKITVEYEDGETQTYDVLRTADIEIDGEDKVFNDLKLGYYVEFKLESNTITSIDAETVDEMTRIIGRVVKVYDDLDTLVLNYTFISAGRKEPDAIRITKNTEIYSTERYRSIDLDDLSQKDNVYVDGYYQDTLFIATKILLLD